MAQYCTIAIGQAYFDERLNTDAWDGATDADKNKALLMSTKRIERLNFLGVKYDDDQDLEFPRDDDTDVPAAIIYACCEEALALLDDVDLEIETENQRMVSLGYGNIRETSDTSMVSPWVVAGISSVEAWRFLRAYLRGVKTVDVMRVS